jgi:hypothetical protein
MTIAPTNLDIANDAELPGVMGDVLATFLRGVDDMIPARVVSYNESTNRVTLKPLVMMGTTDGRKVSRSQVANIPVFRLGAGGFFIRFPVKAGDFGWLKASDRDISLVMQRGGQEDWPNTLRQHSFSDGLFFPDTLRGWAVAGSNADAMVIQSLDGSVCLSLHAGKVQIDAPQVVINGNVQVVGNMAVTGSMTNNSINIGSTHTHGGVDSGPNSTGGPQ